MRIITSRLLILAALPGLAAGCKADRPPAKAATAERADGPRARPGAAPPPRAQARAQPPPSGGDDQGEGRAPWADLSPEERDLIRADVQTRRDERMVEMFATFDADHDGRLSEPERAAMRAARALEAFDRHDADRDGRLSPQELAAMPARGLAPPPDFATVDADHDGFVTVEELDAARPRRGTRGRGDVSSEQPAGRPTPAAPPAPIAPSQP